RQPLMHEKPVVVLVHGLWMTGLELAWLRRRLKADGFETRQFRYSTVRHNLSHNAERLFRFARDIDAREMHFIGYSLGGVVTLNMLARFHAQLPPGRVVLLGSPVRGSSAARGMVRHRWGRFMLGGAGPECLVEDHGVRWQNPR